MSAEPMDLMPYEEQRTRMLMPIVTPDEAKRAIAAYEAMKSAMIRPGDVQRISTKNGPQDFLKKSYWIRIARCFGVRVENVREERLEIDGRIAYRVVNRAIAPDGQSMDGDGFFIEGEKYESNEHNIRARAFTRATNRAISNLVGGGEVSAEEMPEDHEARRPVRQQQPATRRVVEATKPQASLADDMARLHTRALQAGKVTTQEDWERELREAMHLGYNGDERTITREDFPRLVEHFKNLPGKTSSGEDAHDFDLRGEPFRVPA